MLRCELHATISLELKLSLTPFWDNKSTEHCSQISTEAKIKHKQKPYLVNCNKTSASVLLQCLLLNPLQGPYPIAKCCSCPRELKNETVLTCRVLEYKSGLGKHSFSEKHVVPNAVHRGIETTVKKSSMCVAWPAVVQYNDLTNQGAVAQKYDRRRRERIAELFHPHVSGKNEALRRSTVDVLQSHTLICAGGQVRQVPVCQQPRFCPRAGLKSEEADASTRSTAAPLLKQASQREKQMLTCTGIPPVATDCECFGSSRGDQNGRQGARDCRSIEPLHMQQPHSCSRRSSGSRCLGSAAGRRWKD